MIKIVGITACDQGHSCVEHLYCGDIIEEDVAVCLCHVQVIMPLKNGGPGQKVTVVVVYWVIDGIDHCHCHVGFYPITWQSMPPVTMVCLPS